MPGTEPEWRSGRLLDVPTMSQAAPAPSRAGNTWCGRAASSMVYNYYVRARGGTEDEMIRHSREQIRYPDGTLAGTTTGGRASVLEPLQKASTRWSRNPLISPSVREALDGEVPPADVVNDVFRPVVESIDKNNPVVTYTGLSHRTTGPIHIVVFSGYALDAGGALWIHVCDPAWASPGHIERVEADNLHIVQAGEYRVDAGRYWLRAGRLLEYNLNTEGVTTDLWGDYTGRPGIASWINAEPTPDGPYAQDLGTGARGRGNASLPLDLGDGLAPTANAVEAAYHHVERGPLGGWYPVSENTLWHGGVHLAAGDGPARPTVHACLPGTVVAARLGAGEAAEGPFGSRNFVLVRHEMPPEDEPSADETPADGPDAPQAIVPGFPELGQWRGVAPPLSADRWPGVVPSDPARPANAGDSRERPGRAYYSLYMHLAPLDADGGGAGRERPPSPALVTTTGVNVRRAPHKDPDPVQDRAIVADVAPEGTRFEPLPDSPQARQDTDDFQWGRVELADGATDAYMTTNERYLEPEEVAPLPTSAVSWLQTPEVFEVVTGRNYRAAPRTEGNDPIGLAPPGTRFEVLANPPEPEAGRFRWGRVLLPTGPVQAFMSVASPAVRLARPSEPDEDLLRRLAGGDVVAVDRPVRAGEVLWEAGPYGFRQPPDTLSPGQEPAPLPTVLHWEVFSADNLLAHLCRDPVSLDAPASGDGQAGAPPVPRYAAPQTETRLRVRRVDGPETAEVGQEVTFRVADFSAAATPAQRSQVHWELRVGDQAVGRFMSAGDRLTYTPLPAHAGQTLSAHPFMKAPADSVAARTRVEAPPPWWTAEDPGADFQVDAGRVLDLFEGLDTSILGKDLLAERTTVVVEARRANGPARQRPSFEPNTVADPTGHLAYDELTAFYASDPGGRATRLRHAVCRFESEWGIRDVRAAVDTLGVGAPEATAAAVERHQWWAEALAAGADLPAEPRLWHYHPLSFVLEVAGMSESGLAFGGLRVPVGDGEEMVVSVDSVDQLVEHEVSSEAYYTANLTGAVVPRDASGNALAASGVTIGIGYDLGQQSPSQIRSDWSGRLDASTVNLLAAAAGRKGRGAIDALSSLRGIEISFADANHVFRTVSIHEYCRRTYSVYPNVVELHPHSQGALLSLIYNRGVSMDPAKSSRREMRDIRTLMAVERYTEVPTQIRSMKRIWTARGLLKRRDDEAAMFERGLNEYTP